MRLLIKLASITALLLGSASSWGTLYRIDFGGQLSQGTVEGYIILDYTTADVDPDLDRGNFPGLVTELDILINGVRYDTEGIGPIISVIVDRPEGGSGDYLGIGGGVTNSDGDNNFFAIQFQDLSGSAFSSDALPTSLDLTDFSPYTPIDTSSTGLLARPLSSSDLEFVPIDYFEFRQVPIPAAGWLLLSALMTLGLRRK